MPDSGTALLRLLRCELTAVNQQFTHILSLRARGHDDHAVRIAVVNDVDFPNAMRIADYLVRHGIAIRLDGDRFVPGCAVPAVLAAELEMERRMAAALDAAVCADAQQQRLVSDARTPRADYAEWLATGLAAERDPAPPAAFANPEVGSLVAHLLALTEQTLIHALMHRHAGNSDAADASWATSGAAMMHLTYLIRLFSHESTTPGPGSYPPIRIADSPGSAPDCERALAGQCAAAADLAASEAGSPQLAILCDGIADHCEQVSEWAPGRRHPATETNPPAFLSFERTYATYVAPG